MGDTAGGGDTGGGDTGGDITFTDTDYNEVDINSLPSVPNDATRCDLNQDSVYIGSNGVFLEVYSDISLVFRMKTTNEAKYIKVFDEYGDGLGELDYIITSIDGNTTYCTVNSSLDATTISIDSVDITSNQTPTNGSPVDYGPVVIDTSIPPGEYKIVIRNKAYLNFFTIIFF